MRISKKRLEARRRITQFELAILEAMDEVGVNRTEARLAMLSLETRWANDALIKQNPNPKE